MLCKAAAALDEEKTTCKVGQAHNELMVVKYHVCHCLLVMLSYKLGVELSRNLPAMLSFH